MSISNIEFLFSQKKKGIYGLFGAPAAGKTEVLIAACSKILKAGYKVLYIDNSNQISVKRFLPYQADQDLLDRVFIFKPDNNQDLIEQIDDISIHRMAQHAILVIDDIFYYLVGHIDDVEALRSPAIILNLVYDIATVSDFPILYTTQTRRYDNKRKPFLLSISKKFVSYFFEVMKNKDSTITLNIRNFS